MHEQVSMTGAGTRAVNGAPVAHVAMRCQHTSEHITANVIKEKQNEGNAQGHDASHSRQFSLCCFQQKKEKPHVQAMWTEAMWMHSNYTRQTLKAFAAED